MRNRIFIFILLPLWLLGEAATGVARAQTGGDKDAHEILCYTVDASGAATTSDGAFVVQADEKLSHGEVALPLPDGRVALPCPEQKAPPTPECAAVQMDASLKLSPSGKIVQAESYIANPDGTFSLAGSDILIPTCKAKTCAQKNEDGSIVVVPFGVVVPEGGYLENEDGFVSDPKKPDVKIPVCGAVAAATSAAGGEDDDLKGAKPLREEPNEAPAALECPFLTSEGDLIMPDDTRIDAADLTFGGGRSIMLPDGTIVWLCPEEAIPAPEAEATEGPAEAPAKYCAKLKDDKSIVLMPEGRTLKKGQYIANDDGTFSDAADPSKTAPPCPVKICVAPNEDGTLTMRPSGEILPAGAFVRNEDGYYSDPGNPEFRVEPCTE